MEPMRVGGTVFVGSSETGRNTRPIDGDYLVTTNTGIPSAALSVVQCRGCDREFLTEYGLRAVWPLSVPATPADVPPKVAEAYADARRSLAVDSLIGAVMAARTTLIRLQREQGVSRLKELVPDVLTATLYGGGDQARLWADVAGHGDIDVDELQQVEVEALLDHMHTVLEAVYTHPARVRALAERTADLKTKEKK